MKRVPWPAYLCLALWSVWLLAVQGWLAAGALPSPWVPDLGVVLLVSVAARAPLGAALGAAAVVALARSALSADPLPALLAAHMLLAFAAVGVAGAVDADRPVVRVLVSGLAAAALALWLSHTAELRAPAPFAAPVGPLALAGGVGATTAALAFWIGRQARALPGVRPLWRRGAEWELAARAR